MKDLDLRMRVNGKDVEVLTSPNARLIDVLREELGLTSVKEGCGVGECGACTVLMDGEAVNACLVLAGQVEGASIETAESLEQGDVLDPLQLAFIEAGSVQCGYCTPGMLMSSVALLRKKKDPTRDEIRMALAGNLCRCTGYVQIVEAVVRAVQTEKGPGGQKGSKQARSDPRDLLQA